MSESTPPPPSARAVGYRQTVFGGTIALLGVTTAALGGWSAGFPLMVFGSLITGLGVMLRAAGTGVPAVNAAFDAVLRGRVADAERLLDLTEMQWQPSFIRRAVDLQRANLALGRGDLEGALLHAELAVHRPRAILGGANEMSMVASSHAMRALVRVSLGLREGARLDIEAVEVIAEAPPEALARAAVAQAILLERSGDREALAAHLKAKHTLLIDATAPRERTVIRTYQRALAAPRTTVYREGAPREADSADEDAADEGHEVDGWIAAVAPKARAFLRRAPAAEANQVTGPTLVRGVGLDGAPGRGAPGPPVRMMRAPPEPEASQAARLGFWVLLVLLFAGVWQVVAASRAASSPADVAGAALDPAVLLGAFVALLTLMIGARSQRNLRLASELSRAIGAVARERPGAELALARMAHSSDASTAARASAELAKLAERAGDLEAARKHVDAGFATAHRNESTRSVLALTALPELVAERAFLEAAVGDLDAADADMAELAQSYPSYPYMARAELRVGVVACARRGDLVGAGELAASAGTNIPLSHRDETLMDVARAVSRADTVGAVDRDRVRRELRADPELGRWLRVVAPSLLAAFESSPMDAPVAEVGGVEAPRVDRRIQAMDHEDAEREAAAVAEAELAVSEASRARIG